MGLFDLFKQKQEVKSVPAFGVLQETTRDGIQKAFIPQYLYKPPFGYPRNEDLYTVRRLATTPYVEMCISTILDFIAALPWKIVPKEKYEDRSEALQPQIEHVTNFLNNPNTNRESFEHVFIRKALRDVIEVDSGVLNKVFNMKGDMVEVVARDGASFLKNPDVHGMFTDRKDFMINGLVDLQSDPITETMPNMITSNEAREGAAYFQFGFMAAFQPIAFGRREIAWMERNSRTDNVYGRSPVANLATVIQYLIYAVESELEYFNKNNVPKGIIGFEGVDQPQLEAFRQQWNDNHYVTDEAGNLKRNIHQVPVVGVMPKFERISFSAAEMQLIEQQKWYSKLVWSMFGINGSQLGFTEDAKGMANQIVQSKIGRQRAVLPYVRILTNAINMNILSEFADDIENPNDPYNQIEFKFDTFDIDEERSRFELYDLQVKSGIKTINEIRISEGLKEVEYGNEPLKQQSNFSFNPDQNSFAAKEKQSEVKSTESKALKEIKSGEGEGATEEAEDNSSAESKSLSGNPELNPLMLGENEKPKSSKRLASAFNKLLDLNQSRILDLIKDQTKPDIIGNIEGKALTDFLDKIKSMLSFEGMKELLSAVIKNNYYEGFEQAEQTLDRNFIPNTEAISFLQDYTFDNVSGMHEDLANKLRQELSRGLMAGDGTKQLMERVSNVFDVTKSRAEAIARTETNRARNIGKVDAFKASGEQFYKYVSITKDDRTSVVSQTVDAKYGDASKAIPIDDTFEFSVNGKEYRGQAPPFHVNERDVLIVISEDEYHRAVGKAQKKAQEFKSQIASGELEMELQQKQYDLLRQKEELLAKLKGDLLG